MLNDKKGWLCFNEGNHAGFPSEASVALAEKSGNIPPYWFQVPEHIAKLAEQIRDLQYTMDDICEAIYRGRL